MKGKKGSGADLFLWMAIGFISTIMIVVMVYVSSIIHTGILSRADALQNALGPSGNATQIIENTVGKVDVALIGLRWISFSILFFMGLSILITSFFVKTHPVAFVAYLLLSAVAILVSFPISNAYETISQNPTLSATFSGFFATNWFWLHLPIWMAVISTMAGILMFINMIRDISQVAP